AIHGTHAAWRYTLISGLIPAIPLIIIRPFLPESPAWQKKRQEGTLKRPSIAALFHPDLRLTTIATTLCFATTFGLAFGAIQQNPQILAGHTDVLKAVKTAQDEASAKAKEGGKALTPKELGGIKGNTTDKISAGVQSWQEIGGLCGRILLAVLAVRILSRRNLFRIFQIPSLLFVPALYWWLSQNLKTEGSLATFQYAIFIAGMLVVGQMSFWGNYIPLVFPVHLRGTGESFAANIGGRVIGTAAAYLTLTLSAATPPDPARIALMGAYVAGAYAIVGTILTFVLPEPGKVDHHD
ncbi:MAG: MFS transporter, partial [Planctomycetota bacterium]